MEIKLNDGSEIPIDPITADIFVKYIKTKIVWVFTWYDPGKEAEAAQALIDQGADVIMQHTDSTAPVQTAEKAGVGDSRGAGSSRSSATRNSGTTSGSGRRRTTR